MSHFSVAVFTHPDGESVDELLDPYYEGLQVPPYVYRTKEEIIQSWKDDIRQLLTSPRYLEWSADPVAYAERYPKDSVFMETVSKSAELDDEALYAEAINGYEPHQLGPNGEILSRSNPQGKWDWHVIGGRWDKMLKLKPEAITNGQADVDSALVSDIDFSLMEPQMDDIAPYEVAKANYLWGPDAFVDRYPEEATYLKYTTTFYTSAVVTPNGLWHAPGEMGWFGCSSENAEEFIQWLASYRDAFIVPALENGWHLTIVDCHV